MTQPNSTTFAPVYFAILGSYAHTMTIQQWRHMEHFKGLEWGQINFVITTFWVVAFLTALFPLSRVLRVASVAALFMVLYIFEQFGKWHQLLAFSIHVAICFAPQKVWTLPAPKAWRKFSLFLVCAMGLFFYVRTGLRTPYWICLILSGLLIWTEGRRESEKEADSVRPSTL